MKDKRELDWINRFLDDLRDQALRNGLMKTAEAIARAMEVAATEIEAKSGPDGNGSPRGGDNVH